MPRIKPKRKLPKPEQLTEPLGGELALYHKAANIYIHASRADTFPTSVLEAMAERISQLLRDDELRKRIGFHAAESARRNSDLERHADDYLSVV